jgi:hypothetical protein
MKYPSYCERHDAIEQEKQQFAKSHGHVSPQKAKKILKDDSAHGHPLTPRQKRFMGWEAGGEE